MKTKKTITSAVNVDADDPYDRLESLVALRVSQIKGPVFTTDAEGLFAAYLEGFTTTWCKQHYNCNSCRRFIEKYGGLVTIEKEGRFSVLWTDGEQVPDLFFDSVHAMNMLVVNAKITGVFLSSEVVWGTPFNIPGQGSKYVGKRWTHLHGAPSAALRYVETVLSADQKMAEKKEDHAMLCRALADYPKDAVIQAVRVLESDVVDRSEKTLGVAKWLLDLHQSFQHLSNMRKRGNLIWLAVATAPSGWCHIRSSMIATLLDDIVAGLPFEAIKRKWNEKMHPLQYQRPTTLKEGNIEQANKLVAKLGAEESFARRYAEDSDILSWVWKKDSGFNPEKAKSEGKLFDHLRKQTNKIKPVELPTQVIGWEKFRDEVLSSAYKVEYYVDYGVQSFYGLTTAVNADAPPLLQWDGLVESQVVTAPKDMSAAALDCGAIEEELSIKLPRNPVAWYFYVNGSTPSHWGLNSGWTEVSMIFLKPCFWQQPEKFKHQGAGVFFALPKAKDIAHKTGGGFFLETLRSEYYSIRPAMEAYARNAEVLGKEEGNVNGIALGFDNTLTLRINDSQEYKLRGK